MANPDISNLAGCVEDALIATLDPDPGPEDAPENPNLQDLFEAHVNVYPNLNGVAMPLDDSSAMVAKTLGSEHFSRVTFLKEAEVMENGERLDPLGSGVVAEAICGGMFDGKEYKFDANWKLEITNRNVITFADLIDFIDEDRPVLVTSAARS